ncbi:MAG: carboxylating nicotinate-nucleotide diphosphorylase [Gammaproteobacteria bacterium]|nr:carboxylating nicotinate-nucleotide diphosphorylase [Gammaproteobacteria bacterium]NIM71860.1 carboxylating nicotinate-nucleotide diphosphorylase [Gammaproteobacteria bacterium]NIN37982.1 carboxylating nicotinate-nucleotide diphosphorylase [Gammaproteobacteria bacterium]NIO23616.1 carboxylating nicotinate-nucleotide diphosphorylase [Gammaproteobacteria bacterium]NIO64232.1 carboxylating nicotinate-nucleotide diphosphorylase [Gammaproteobacteria bacterium]
MNDRATPPRADEVTAVVRRALEEDVGSGDVTARLVAPDAAISAAVICREAAVLCGAAWFEEVFRQLDPHIAVRWRAADGDALEAGDVICHVTGPAAAVLTGERSALNFLQLLSGTATTARRYARAVEGSGTRVIDTRKTLPGLRSAQKYAVRCGGCHNHRQGLYDAVLIKDNHIAHAGSIAKVVAAARRDNPGLTVEVEVESLAQLDEALQAGADIVMLDNFDRDDIREAVARARGRARLEISGNVEIDDLPSLAETGVDYISVGAMTKHVRAIDFSMDFESDERPG